MDDAGTTLVRRLQRATNDHDLDGLVDCFATDYRNETPVHPAQGFDGREQVRTNWQRIFTAIPDITADVLRTACEGDVVWSEWEMRGTRPDGSAHVMRGVIIFGTHEQRAAWARFYLEALDPTDADVDTAVGRIVDKAVTT
jgi:ketosteroid isomerase-like protein